MPKKARNPKKDYYLFETDGPHDGFDDARYLGIYSASSPEEALDDYLDGHPMDQYDCEISILIIPVESEIRFNVSAECRVETKIELVGRKRK